MFYVNDIEGLRFKGSLEELEAWGQVSRKGKVQALAEENRSSEFSNQRGAQAVTAYQKFLPKKNMVEPLVHAHQIMSSPVITILPETSLSSAWLQMRDSDVRQLVVITGRREVLGMLTERDILKRINVIDNKVQASQELFVNDVLSRDIVSTHAISDIRRIAKVLAQFHLDALPVLEDERLVGIVTRGDILRGFAENPKLNLWA